MTTTIHPLRAYRSLNQLTADELAKRLGISESGLRHWENGTRQIPPEQCVEIEERIGLDRAILRPDLFKREAA